MKEQWVVIIAEGIDDTQRRQIQSEVKKKSNHWLHEMANMWLAEGGGGVGDWHGRLDIIIADSPANLLILSLPDDKQRGFAAIMPERAVKWLTDIFGSNRVIDSKAAPPKMLE